MNVRELIGTLLVVALAYAARGWPVLPCCWPDAAGHCACPKLHTDPKEIGKAPLTDRGVKDATTNAAQIERWWAQWPDANVAVDLAGAGLFLLDGDSGAAIKEAHHRSGAAGLPPAPIARSGRGDGWHYYYQRPADCPLYTTVRRGESATLDLKTSGYGILPPSLHRSGRHYAWESPPDAVPLREPPSWAVALLVERATRQATTREAFPPDETHDGAAVWAQVRGHLAARIVCTVDGGPGAYVARLDGDPTASGADAAVCYALVRFGLTDAQIRAIFRATAIGRLGKYARRGDAYLSATLANARALAGTVSEMSEPPSRMVLRVEVA
jgi:hypothetical protein